MIDLVGRLKIVFKMLFAFNIKNYMKAVKELLTLIIIFTILISFSMLLKVYEHNMLAVVQNGKYDLVIQGFTTEQINEINNLDFVSKIFTVRSLSTTMTKSDKLIEGNLYACDSFKDLDISYFSDKMLIKKDSNIMDQKNKNPILIDWDISKTLHIDIGDSMLIPFAPNGVNVDFTVAGIYQPMKSMELPSAMCLWSGNQKKVFFDNFKKNPEYTLMFIKAKDLEKAEKYFFNEYIPKEFMKTDKRIISSNELHKYNLKINSTRQNQIDLKLNELEFTPPIVLITSIMGFLLFAILLFRESNKKLIMNEKSFTILNAIGLPKIYIMFYFIIETVLLQIPIIIFSSFIVKYVIYDLLIPNLYLPMALLANYAIVIFAIQIVASVLSGVMVYYNIKKMNIANLLAKE